MVQEWLRPSSEWRHGVSPHQGHGGKNAVSQSLQLQSLFHQDFGGNSPHLLRFLAEIAFKSWKRFTQCMAVVSQLIQDGPGRRKNFGQDKFHARSGKFSC